MDKTNNLNFDSRCVHAGQSPDKETGAIMTPVYLSSTYVQDGPGKHKGFEYSRTQNPTRNVLQNNIKSLENGRHCFCFSSGCAATSILLMALKAGDHIVAMDDLYGGTHRLFENVFSNFNLQTSFVDLSNIHTLKETITSRTKLIWIETPTNPLLKLVDIQEVCDIAHENNIMVAVDNTFATPALQKPLDLGADFVLHSTTKYLGGHSDVIGGALITNHEDWADKISYLANAIGATPSPLDCYLVLRGIKTLALRMNKHVQNAQIIARFLADHPSVQKVYYPGLPSHPNHSLCSKQMSGPGGMISFETNGGLEIAKRVLNKTQIFALAESLGCVESLIEHPGIMTHSAVDQKKRDKLGISDSLIRLSIGIEDPNDLMEDLSQALND